MNRQSSVTDGEAIRLARERLNLSREGLAYKSGVALRTIERIETGESIPRRATLTVIEQALADAEPTGAAA